MPKDYWRDRQGRAQQKLTEKSIKETEKQLKKYYLSTMKEVIGQFETTYLHVLSSIEDGKDITPADLYKLDKYWQLQGQLKTELQKLGDKQHKAMSRNFMKQYERVYKTFAFIHA